MKRNGGSIGVSKFLPVQFPGKKGLSQLLIDSGSSVTVLSKELFDSIPQEYRPELNTDYPGGIVLESANGGVIKTYGQATITFTIGQQPVEHTVFVSEIKDQGLLGDDFIDKHVSNIDVKKSALLINGKWIPCIREESVILVARVTVHDEGIIPAGHEVVVEGDVHDWMDKSKFGVVEPSRQFFGDTYLLMASSLVEAGGDHVYLRVMNTSKEDFVLRKGASIAHVHPVEDVIQEPVTQGEGTIRKVSGRVDSVKSTNRSGENIPSHLLNLYQDTITSLDEAQTQLESLLIRYSDVFAKSTEDLGCTDIAQHEINTGSAKPVRSPPRWVPIAFREEESVEIGRMLKNGIIQESTSPWAAPIVLVRKKDGTVRFCVDYRKLNSLTHRDAYPLPRIDECLDCLEGSSWYSTLDLQSGYFQLKVKEEDRPKTAFVTRDGLFEFLVMPFGLCNAPSTFERAMELILHGLQWSHLLVYLDDVIVIGKTFNEHLGRLEEVFKRFSTNGLKIKPSKCHLCKDQVAFLGHVMSKDGVSTDPQKVGKVSSWPQPQTVTEVRGFLGLCGYYRKFVKDFATLAAPLFKLMEKDSFRWSSSCQESFDTLKSALVNAPVTAYPSSAEGDNFILDTDASDVGIGAVLTQVQNGTEKVISYASRSLSKAERRYCTTRKELLAIVFFTEYFRHYLLGRSFEVRTDHSALRWIFTFKNPEGQMARWLEMLMRFDFKVTHRPGKLHGNADALSRRPCDPSNCNCSVDGEARDSLSCGPCKHCMRLDGKFDSPVQSGRRVQLTNSCKSKLYTLWTLIVSYVHVICTLMRTGTLGCSQASVRRVTTRGKGRVPPSTTVMQDEVIRGLHSAEELRELQSNDPDLRKILQWFGESKARPDRKHVTPESPATRALWQAWDQLVLYRVGAPLDRIATDIFGPLPKSKAGNVFILVVQDYFTRWVEMYAIPDQTAETVAGKIVNEFISRFGAPLELHSDQGRNYTSDLFKQMCSLLEIRKTSTTSYRPISNGMVERFNQTMANMIAAFVDDNQTNWDTFLPLLAMAYRSSLHPATGFTPNRLMLGREITAPADLLYGCPGPRDRGEDKAPAYVQTLEHKMQEVHNLVREHLATAAERQKKNYDTKICVNNYNVGDFVYLRHYARKVGKCPKLQVKYKGPYVVVKKLSDWLYEVKASTNTNRTVIVHHDRMRAYLSVVPPKLKHYSDQLKH